MPQPTRMFVLIAFAMLGAAANSFAQPDPPPREEPKPAEESSKSANIEARLAELEAEKRKCEEKLAAIQEEIQKANREALSGKDAAFEEAKSKFSESVLTRLGSAVVVGDLRVTLVSLSYQDRTIEVKERFDFQGKQPHDLQIPVFGPVVKIENLSEGKIAKPFDEGNMFGGLASCFVADSWGNRLQEQELQSSKFEMKASLHSDFVLPGERILPKETKSFLFAVATPEVANIKFMVVRFKLKDVGPSGKDGQASFFVPAANITGLTDAVAKAKAKSSDR